MLKYVRVKCVFLSPDLNFEWSLVTNIFTTRPLRNSMIIHMQFITRKGGHNPNSVHSYFVNVSLENLVMC